jgi:hypothetical protein
MLEVRSLGRGRRRLRAYVPRDGRLADALAESCEHRAWLHRRHSALGGAFKMAARLFDNGRNSFNTGGLSYTVDTIKAMLLDVSVAGTFNKLITSVTNANPAVATSAAHGFANNDILVVGGLTGGSLNFNQTMLANAVAANTFQGLTLNGGFNIATSTAYSAGGYAIDLTQAVFVAGILGTRVGTDQTLAGKTSVAGVANATSPITWPTIAGGNTASAVIFYDAAGGSDAANRLIGWQDGKNCVIVDKAVSGADTSIVVEPLKAQLWDGTTGAAPIFYWSDGHTSTLNAAANQGDRSVTITAQAVGGVALGSQADMSDFGGGLPFVTGGFGFQFTIGTIYAPTLPTGIYKL